MDWIIDICKQCKHQINLFVKKVSKLRRSLSRKSLTHILSIGVQYYCFRQLKIRMFANYVIIQMWNNVPSIAKNNYAYSCS